MIVYVIFQESLYNAINKCKQIMPAEINARKIKIEGYADDTTVFLNDDQSIPLWGYYRTGVIIGHFNFSTLKSQI